MTSVWGGPRRWLMDEQFSHYTRPRVYVFMFECVSMCILLFFSRIARRTSRPRHAYHMHILGEHTSPGKMHMPDICNPLLPTHVRVHNLTSPPVRPVHMCTHILHVTVDGTRARHVPLHCPTRTPASAHTRTHAQQHADTSLVARAHMPLLCTVHTCCVNRMHAYTKW